MIRRVITGLVWSALVFSQALLPGPSVSAQETAVAAGQEDLDRAMQTHANARTVADLEKVIALCDKALSAGLSEEDQQFAHHLAASCLFQRASNFASVVLERQPRHPRWQQLREIALADLDRAISHVPDLREAHDLICDLTSLEGGDRERGLKAANELMRLAGDDKNAQAEAYLTRARFHENPEEQLADLNRAAELDPENREPLELRAGLLVALQRFDEAATTLRELIQKDDQNAKFHLALAEVLSSMEGKSDEALQEIERALELEPKSVQAYIVRARLHVMKEDLDAALADLNAALAIDENDILALLFRAELYLVRDNLDAAREDVDKVLRVQPNLVAAIQLRSRLHVAEGKFESAIADMELLVENDPQNVELRLQLANFYNAADRPRKAIKIASQVLEQDPENWRALRTRGDASLSVGKHAEAIADYEKALTINGSDSGLLNNLAWVLATSPEDNLRNGQRAIELATKACELTEYKQAHILSTLASGYAETGDFETAIEWSTKAVELDEGDSKEQLQKELESYQQSKPWREKQETVEKPDIPQRDLLET